jgi:hypothetical protein
MKNPAAVALGRLAAGVPKRFSRAERARRAAWARGLAARCGRARKKPSALSASSTAQ